MPQGIHSEEMSLHQVTVYERPATLGDAFASVAAGGIPVSGGTDVILHPRTAPVTLVDLTGLAMAAIAMDEDALVVGANATLSELLEHPASSHIADGVIATMLREVGSPLLRNIATIGGHLARGRLSDVIPVLLALDATIRYHDGSERSEPLAAFYRKRRHATTLIVTGVSIPVPRSPSGAAFRKFSRTGFDLAILNAACRIDVEGGTVSAARVVVGETPALGASVTNAETALVGEPLGDRTIARAAATAAAEIPARDDARASAEYRRALAEVLVRRCLEEIAGRLT
jgi:CO/xanthine dehydrogenase FAD-binding subunit